jgi:hypothetical protein
MSKPGESPNLDDSVTSPIRLFRFAPDILDLIVDVVAPASPARDALKQGVDALFSDHWQVMTWSDLSKIQRERRIGRKRVIIKKNLSLQA